MIESLIRRRCVHLLPIVKLSPGSTVAGARTRLSARLHLRARCVLKSFRVCRKHASRRRGKRQVVRGPCKKTGPDAVLNTAALALLISQRYRIPRCYRGSIVIRDNVALGCASQGAVSSCHLCPIPVRRGELFRALVTSMIRAARLTVARLLIFRAKTQRKLRELASFFLPFFLNFFRYLRRFISFDTSIPSVLIES